MTGIIRKIHMYLGLVCATALLVYAIAGLWAFTFVRPQERPRRPPEQRAISFEAPANASDQQAARLMWQALNDPMTGPPPAFAIRRNNRNQLAFTVYSVNGLTRVLYLEGQKKLEIEKLPSRLGGFFMALHEMTPRHPAPDLRNHLWKYYNEFAIWALVLMVLSGIYLWLASRPGWLWARMSFALGTGWFLVFYWIGR